MAYNLNSWRDLLVSGFAFAVANPALIVLHSKKNFAVDGRNYVSMTGRELANVCRIYVNVNSDNNTICSGSEWGLWVNGQQGRDNCVLVTILPCRGHGKEGVGTPRT